MNRVYLFNTENYYDFFPVDDKRRDTIVIVPGGGYDHCSDLEANNVAEKFNEHGYHAVVLKYRNTLDKYPFPQKLLASTIDAMKKNELVLKIFTIGFSAGGHLVLSNACYKDEYGYDSMPDGLILCYPVISSVPQVAHNGSFKNLLKEDYNERNLDKLSLEKHIPSNLPPVFLWHCFTDEAVPVTNSLLLLESLKEKNIKTECHIFSEGVHGMSLSNETTGLLDSRKNNSYVSRWFLMLIEWLNHNF